MSVKLVSFQRPVVTIQRVEVSLALMVAVRQTYLGSQQLHGLSRGMIIEAIWMRLRRQHPGLCTGQQIADALDLLVEKGQILPLAEQPVAKKKERVA